GDMVRHARLAQAGEAGERRRRIVPRRGRRRDRAVGLRRVAMVAVIIELPAGGRAPLLEAVGDRGTLLVERRDPAQRLRLAIAGIRPALRLVRHGFGGGGSLGGGGLARVDRLPQKLARVLLLDTLGVLRDGLAGVLWIGCVAHALSSRLMPSRASSAICSAV